MKKIYVFLLCLAGFAFLKAQPVTSFSTDHDKFMKELEQYMTAGKNENNIQAMESMKAMIKEGKLSSGVLDQAIITANAMAGRMMAASPYFLKYINSVTGMVKGGKTDEQFADWNKILTSVLKNQRKGDNNEFLKFLDFSDVFFQQNALSVTPARTWRVDASSYRFVYDNNKPHVSFTSTNLIGSIKDDTVTIKQTTGDYYPLETKWEGQSGRVDWARAHLDPNKVYCTFKNYSINISNVSYTIDTVTFYQSDYFKQPLRGRLIDKLVAGADSANMTYPRFESYDVGMTVKDIAPNVYYTGGFSMHGSKVLGYGTPEEKAQLTFYARDGKTKVVSVRSQSIMIKKGEELGADRAEVSIYFGTDSIYHPQLNLVYKSAKREMRLLRGETGMSKAKFLDSYHNFEFQTDAIFWNLDSSVLNLKILSGVGQKPGIYESVNYFNKELIRRTQGYAAYEPLSILKRMYEKNGDRNINALDLARTIDPNLKEGEIKSLLYQLVEGGFIGYDEGMGIVTVKDKAINYVLANAKKIDYDIIHIRSSPQSGNDYIDLQNSNIDLKGVIEVPITDTAHVSFRPKGRTISLQKDRNMEFDGVIYAGRMDLIGERHKFQYAPFTVDLTKVDTLRINVPDSNKVDEYGNPILKPLKSKVEGIKGLLEIDAPINKSGRTRLPQFPKLFSREKSFIYYDDPDIAKGAYDRKSFFFELQPFHLDSLNTFSPDIINWQGKLVSGGIFPDVKDSVHLQGDASLGFKSETPPEGYDLYKGKGKYYGKFELNYNGLQGSGRITHSTAEFKADDVHLYPDSLRATTDTFTIKKTFDGVKTPAVTGVSDAIFWKPVSDSMYIDMMDKTKPFVMYDDGFTTFKGGLLLDATSLRGNGTLDWNEATLASKNFLFRTMDLSADTSSLEIKTTGDKITFKSPNVAAKVDFKTRIGDFVSNQKDVPTEFAYNQYTTAINQFKWYMDEKILDFRVPEGSVGGYFTSTRPDQKGLKFLGKRATYNLVSSLLRVEQVPEIRVADGSVIPDSGIVIIEEQAKMHQLRNAVIIADTINKSHRFENATVDIYSKEELKAAGDYNYTTRGIKQTINFGDIACKKESDGKGKKDQQFVRITAKSNVDEKQNFVLYPDVNFNGEISVISISPLINFKGYAKLNLKHPKAGTSDFFINQPVNRDTLGLQYSDSTRNSTGNPISTGVHLNPNPEAPSLYSTLMIPKQDNNDLTLFKVDGMVTQVANGDYLFGDEKRIKENNKKGNLLRYDDKRGNIMADGGFDLGLNLGLIKTATAGSFGVKLDTIQYKFNFTMGIDVLLADKMQERMEFYMIGDNASQPDISYEKEDQKKPFYQLADEKKDKKWVDEFEKTAALAKRPEGIPHNLLFTDVTFVFDPDDVTLRSVGKIGVAMIGKKVINKKVDGYIEYQYKTGGDALTIYLETGTKGWFYIDYKPGMLGVLSSYDDMNKTITDVSPEKRRIKGDKGKYYLYTLGSSLNKEDFVAYMKDKANGIFRPRPEPHIEIPAMPSMEEDSMLIDSITGEPIMPAPKEKSKRKKEIEDIQQMQDNGEPILSGPPPDRKPAKKKSKKDGEEEQQENMEQQTQPDPQQQQQINEAEKMRMNNQPILSSPPPDRNKKKEEEKPAEEKPVQETPEPAAEPVKEEPKQEEPEKAAPKKEAPVKKEKAPKKTPKQEAPETDAEPVTPGQPEPEAVPPAEPVKEQPKQETPPQENVVPPTEPKKEEVLPVEVPKTENVTPPTETKPEVPATEEPKKEEPKQEEAPKSEAPKTDNVVPTKEQPKENTPPPATDEPKKEEPKQEVEQPKTEVPKTDAMPPVQDPPQPEPAQQDSIPK